MRTPAPPAPVPLVRRAPRAALPAAALAVVLDVAALALLGAAPPAAAALHVLAALLAALGFAGGRDHLAPFIAQTALCFPVLGPAAAVAVALARRRTHRSRWSALHRYNRLVAGIAPDRVDQEAAGGWDALATRPLGEIARDPETPGPVLAAAIEGTRELDPAVAARLLRGAMASAIPDVRYHAAHALIAQEERLEREATAAVARLGAAPGDAGAALALARIHMALAALCPAGDELTRHHLQHALPLLTRCVTPGGGTGPLAGAERDDAEARLAAVHARLGHPREAIAHGLALIERGCGAPAVLEDCLAACLAAGELDTLRRVARVALQRCPGAVRIEEVTRPWIADPAP